MGATPTCISFALAGALARNAAGMKWLVDERRFVKSKKKDKRKTTMAISRLVGAAVAMGEGNGQEDWSRFKELRTLCGQSCFVTFSHSNRTDGMQN